MCGGHTAGQGVYMVSFEDGGRLDCWFGHGGLDVWWAEVVDIVVDVESYLVCV